MAIQLTCTACGKQFRIKEQFRGTKLKCPNCKQELLVQGPYVQGYDVFVSYSSTDKQVADAVCAAMESKGVRCWIAPRDIPPGASWGAAIIEGMEDSRTLVLVFSSHSNASDQVLREVERAVAKKVPILPLRIDDTRMGKSLEYFLGACHWLNATDGPLEKHLGQLTSTVRSLLLDRAEVEHHRRPAANPSFPPAVVQPATAPSRGGGRKFVPVAAAVLLVVAAAAGLTFRGRQATPAPVATTRPASAVVAATTRAAPPDGDSWLDLFNGTDYTGWQVQRSRAGVPRWIVREGILFGSGVNGFLVCQKGRFTNFHLRVEAKIDEGGNAGVMFRVQGEQPLAGGCYEAQIQASGTDPVKTGGVYGYFGGRNRSVLAGAAASPVGPNQWFTLEVIAQGPHFVVLVDGKKTADFEDRRFARGTIALQHQGPGAVVLFRKIQIRELPPSS